MTAKIQYEDIDLYHYTSLASLFAILQNETIRLTDYRFLNDTQELSYATHWLKALLQPMAENEFVQKLLTAIENIEQGKVERLKGIGEDLPYLQWNMCDLNYYILSLSQNYDDLAMWRMYAKDGCSIKFNSQKLNEFLYSLRGDNLKNGFNTLNFIMFYFSCKIQLYFCKLDNLKRIFFLCRMVHIQLLHNRLSYHTQLK